MFEAMKSRHLEPALTWVAKQTDRLKETGSSFGLKIHQLKFADEVQKGNITEAVKHAETFLDTFTPAHKVVFLKLMGCLVCGGNLHQSPYAEFVSPTWKNLAEEFTQQFCSLLGQSSKSPLSMVIAAGILGLPTLLKLASLRAAKNPEWRGMKQLTVLVDLGKEFQFHSIFVCSVHVEQTSDENPPMLMPCGYVISKHSVVILSETNTYLLKCPICSSLVAAVECRQLHF